MDNTVGEKIKKFRKRAGVSQFELELRINASPGSISRIESGQVNPTKETISKIVQVLNLKMQEAAALYEIRTDELPQLVQLAKKLSSKLNLDELLQDAVNQTVYDLNLFGCILFLCDDEYVYAKTQTDTWYLKFVNAILPQPLGTMKLSLKDTENYVVKTIVERKPQMTTILHNFSKNVFPDRISDVIQKYNGTKCGISLPMIVDDKVIGALVFSKNNEDNFDVEYKVLEAFTVHIAISIMNALKYKELEDKFINQLSK
jgi:transcriptional regulator with XRE-family HTH domain